MKKQSFNKDWIFWKEGGSPVSVELPHDAMIIDERSPQMPSDSGDAFFVGGKYFYEKKLEVPADWAEKNVRLQFEGVYRNARVFVNGKEAGGRPYGYIPFFVELSGLLKYGAENTVRVEADSLIPNSRWYPGGGIYRPVWLWLGEKSYIEPQGVRITTLSYSPARIKVCTAHSGGEVRLDIFDGEKLVASGEGDCTELDIPDAKLWSDETPHLYCCKVILIENGEPVDECCESFGIRVVEWSTKGLFVNGKETLLRGGCVHHDNGILGARSFEKAEERRVRMLKENGYNAIRSAHNPAARATLDACDKYGVYMMDETWDMWYGHKTKYDYADRFMDNWEGDIEALVERDYNHPSVILYSIGNEVGEPGEPKGVELAKKLIEKFHRLDPSRPVTGGMNLLIINQTAKGTALYKGDGSMSVGGSGEGGKDPKTMKMSSTMYNMIVSMVGPGMNNAGNSKRVDRATSPVLDALDIAGYNYASGRYPLEAKAHANRIVVGSETFPQDIAKNWAMVKKYPYVIGDFMWTSWDYLGEAGIGAWTYDRNSAGFAKPYPWLLAEAGAFDILGNETAEVGFTKAVWNKLDAPYIGVRPVNHGKIKPGKSMWRGTNAIPSWSWKGCEGNKATVEVFYDAYEIALLLDVGKKKPVKLGRRKVKDYLASFKVKYRPGELIAVAYDENGSELSRSRLVSASGKEAIRVLPEESSVKAGELVYVNIDIVGENGEIECNADAKLSVTVENGELLAFGSANPCTTERFESGSYTSYYGRALAVVKCAASGGEVKVLVKGEGLNDACATISAE